MTVYRVLKEAGYAKTKPTRKPGLTLEMKEARLKWALGHRRGGYRIGRKANERVVKSCIRERYKGYSEFMFWACFTYDKKGLCHIYKPETKVEKAEAAKKIAALNLELEPIMRAEWELTTAMRTGLMNNPGKKPVWRLD